MTDWLSYHPRDFLLFSERTYWRLFDLHNETLWPLQIVALPGVGLAIGAALWGWRHAGLAAALLFGAAWAGVAALFLDARYEPINWAVAWIEPLIWAEAALLLALAPGLRFEADGRRVVLGGALGLAALCWPLLAPLSGRPLVQAEIAGLAPDPTALATLALLVAAGPGWRRSVLSVAPLFWLSASAATLQTMGAAGAGAATAALAAAVAALILTHRSNAGAAAASARDRRPRR